MRKNSRLWWCLLVVLIITFVIIRHTDYSRSDSVLEKTSPSTWTWEQDKSYLIGINVYEEEGTVEILYSFCFSNHSDKTYTLAPISASFSWFDLFGWMEYDNCIYGERQDGEYYTYLYPNETTNVIFSFSGKYLGGKVKSNIATPTEIMYMEY